MHVSRGAVMSKLGIGPTVTSTKAAKHYGTSCNATWKPIRDRGFPKVHDYLEDEDRCEIMSWFIYKVRHGGSMINLACSVIDKNWKDLRTAPLQKDDLSREKKIQLSFYRKWEGKDPTKLNMKVTDELFECSDLLAPVHPGDGKSSVSCEMTAVILCPP